jgi:uncharacterized protein (DUF427 family)
MATAIWEGMLLAKSNTIEIVEGNIYFPPNSIKKEYFRDSDTHTVCPWKGLSSYYDIVVGDKINTNAAWYYPDPNPAAKQIKGYVAFDGHKEVNISK